MTYRSPRFLRTQNRAMSCALAAVPRRRHGTARTTILNLKRLAFAQAFNTALTNVVMGKIVNQICACVDGKAQYHEHVE